MRNPILTLAARVAGLSPDAQAALVTIADTLRKSNIAAPRRGRPRTKATAKVAAPAKAKTGKVSDVDRLLSKTAK